MIIEGEQEFVSALHLMILLLGGRNRIASFPS
jgi:hypothetical protein